MNRPAAGESARRRTRFSGVRRALLTLFFAGLPVGVALGDDSDVSHADVHPEIIEAIEIGGVDVGTGTLLLSGQEGGDVDGAMSWSLGPAREEGRVEVRFVVEVEGFTLLSGFEGDRLAIALLAYVVGEGNTIVDHIAQGVLLDARQFTDSLMATGLKFLGRTTLEPGTYTLRAMVREQSTGHFFMARSRIDVPLEGETPDMLQPPLFRDDGGGWVVVRQQGPPDTSLAATPPFGLPAARPVLVEGLPSEFLVGGRAAGPGDRIEARLVDRAGRVVAEYPLEHAEAPASEPGFRRVRLPPLDLPPGRYNLVLRARTPGDEPDGRRSTEVVVVGSDAPRTWTRLSERSGTATSRPAGHESPARFRRKKARAAYLDALSALAAGDEVGARRRLSALEKSAMTEDVLRALRRVEDGVAAEVAGHNPRGLLPIALLHQQMVRRYVARREFVLAAYARAIAADRARQIGDADIGGGLAEALLVSLASDLSRTASASLSREFLEQALVFDSEYRPALLALGASFERAAEYGKAANVFEQLVESDPGDEEGWLRLAINLARSGRERAAFESFNRLISGHPDDWIAILAAQEQARLMVRNNAPEEALEVLEKAILRYPNDQRLRVYRAWVLDASGRPLDAVATLVEIPPAEHEESPRLRYGEWPDLGAEVSAAAISETAKAALPNLGTALESLESSS
jgi:tetratricopeptide (TPR) repeat protein